MATAFVTGAASGIGRAIAAEWARRGGALVGTYWGPEEELAEFSDEVERLGGRAFLRNVDVRSHQELAEFAASAVERFGPLDLWVNCAARLLVRPFDETDDEEWRDLLDSNLMGYVRGCRIASATLRDGGSIVNVSSVNSTFPARGLSAYATAKGGVESLTRALAVEYGSRIRVNAVAPGAIDTPLNTRSWTRQVRDFYDSRAALGRTGSAEEIAQVVIALGSDEMTFVTGQVIVADGGLTINGTAGHDAH